MIEFLKRGKYGRATFLPLTAIGRKGNAGNKDAVKEPGILGVASTLVRTEEKYRALVEYLLGRTLVADNMDHAIAAARKYHHSADRYAGRRVFKSGRFHDRWCLPQQQQSSGTQKRS